jgi:hypothetical protein
MKTADLTGFLIPEQAGYVTRRVFSINGGTA